MSCQRPWNSPLCQGRFRGHPARQIQLSENISDNPWAAVHLSAFITDMLVWYLSLMYFHLGAININRSMLIKWKKFSLSCFNALTNIKAGRAKNKQNKGLWKELTKHWNKSFYWTLLQNRSKHENAKRTDFFFFFKSTPFMNWRKPCFKYFNILDRKFKRILFRPILKTNKDDYQEKVPTSSVLVSNILNNSTEYMKY